MTNWNLVSSDIYTLGKASEIFNAANLYLPSQIQKEVTSIRNNFLYVSKYPHEFHTVYKLDLNYCSIDRNFYFCRGVERTFLYYIDLHRTKQFRLFCKYAFYGRLSEIKELSATEYLEYLDIVNRVIGYV